MLYTLQPVRLQSECLARLFGNYDNSLDPLPLLPNLRDPSARNIGMFGLSVDLSAAPFDCSVFARRVFLLTELIRVPSSGFATATVQMRVRGMVYSRFRLQQPRTPWRNLNIVHPL